MMGRQQTCIVDAGPQYHGAVPQAPDKKKVIKHAINLKVTLNKTTRLDRRWWLSLDLKEDVAVQLSVDTGMALESQSGLAES